MLSETCNNYQITIYLIVCFYNTKYDSCVIYLQLNCTISVNNAIAEHFW